MGPLVGAPESQKPLFAVTECEAVDPASLDQCTEFPTPTVTVFGSNAKSLTPTCLVEACATEGTSKANTVSRTGSRRITKQYGRTAPPDCRGPMHRTHYHSSAMATGRIGRLARIGLAWTIASAVV